MISPLSRTILSIPATDRSTAEPKPATENKNLCLYIMIYLPVGVCGASIESTLLSNEHNACIEFLMQVGNSSDVSMQLADHEHRYKTEDLTSNGVCGATMDPTLPKDEHSACIEFLVYVGKSSDVYM